VDCQTAYLRHDPMGLFFSGLSVIAITNWHGWKAVSASAVFAAAAFLTKQTFLTAFIACLFFQLLMDRKAALLFAAIWFGLIGSAIAAIHFAGWGGTGIWFSWFVAPRNPLRLGIWIYNCKWMVHQPVFTVILLLSIMSVSVAFVRQGWQAVRDSPLLAYLGVATLAVLITAAKDGASHSTFFEFELACLLWLTHSVRAMTRETATRWISGAVLLACCLCAATELVVVERASYSYVDSGSIEAGLRSSDQIRNHIAELGVEKPKLLNLTVASRFTYQLTDTCYFNDPYLYDLLWKTRVLTNAALCRAIAGRKFDLILLPAKGEPTIVWRPVFHAAESSYRTARTDAFFRYLVPNKGGETSSRLGQVQAQEVQRHLGRPALDFDAGAGPGE
jgi:hypothetical protein